MYFALWPLAPLTTHGQEPAQGQDSQPVPDQNSAESPSNSADRPVTNSLDTGQSVDGHYRVLSPIHIAHMSILSFSAFYTFDSNYALQSTGSSASNDYGVRTLILYSTGSERSGLDIQYQPYLYVRQGAQQSSANLENRLSLRAFHNLSNQWIWDLEELFFYSPNSGTQIDPTITANYLTGEINLRPFLGIGYEEINNHLTTSLADHLTPKDTLSFRADYNYAALSKAPTSGSSVPASSQGFQTENNIGGGVTWTHQVQAQQIGLAYNYTRQVLSGRSAREQYHTLLATYSRMLRPTLEVRLSIGPSVQFHGNGKPASETVVGTASAQKMFRSSSLLFSFSRDYQFTGVPTDGYFNRWDGSYSQSLKRRWVLSVGGGYIQQNSSIAANLSGRSLWIGPEYRLTDRWSILVQFANSALAGGLQQMSSRYLLSVGLHWSALPVSHGMQP
jgi:hypothetical protein